MERISSTDADKWVKENFGEDCEWLFCEGLALEEGMTLLAIFPDTVIVNYNGHDKKGIVIVHVDKTISPDEIEIEINEKTPLLA